MEEKTRKIAILVGQHRGDYDEDFVATNITEWTEVTEEEYQLLLKARGDYRLSQKVGYFTILEQPIDPKKWVFDTVQEFMVILQREEEEKAAERRRQEEKRAEQAAKRKMSSEAKLRSKMEKAIRENPDLAKEILDQTK